RVHGAPGRHRGAPHSKLGAIGLAAGGRRGDARPFASRSKQARKRESVMLKIWGRNTSSNVQKVMWAVGELGLEHERVDIGGKFGGNKGAAYLAMNPNRLVPTLQDGELTPGESNTLL